MIEQITLRNFLSFRDEETFDFTASMEKPKKEYSFMKWFEEMNKKKILKAQFLFGNNATGKSNFLHAIAMLVNIICMKRTSKTAKEFRLRDTFFKLSSATINRPSAIKVVFHINKIRYTYQVEYNDNTIIYELLERQDGSKKPIKIFERNFDKEKDIVIINYPSKNISLSSQSVINETVIKNTSVISVYDEKNIESEDLKNVYTYFSHIGIFNNLDDLDLASMLDERKDKDPLKEILLDLLKDLGSNIVDYKIKKFKIKIGEKEKNILKMALGEDVFNEEYAERTISKVEFAHPADLPDGRGWLTEDEESEGTINMIKLIIILYEASRRKSPIIIDDCAVGIHRETFGRIIQFFLAVSSNIQFIMSSQQLSIMEMKGFRRDTVRFFDKNRQTGVTSCQSIDLRRYHKNLSILNAYLNNSFGCLPASPPLEEWIVKLEEYYKAKINQQ